MAIALLTALVLAAHFAWRARALASDLARERLTVLSMELRPHFLLNALNAAAELVHIDPDAADEAITALGQLLSHSLRHGERHEVSLAEEIALLRHYVVVERARFGDRLRVEVEAPATLHGASVPPLLMQPLVENAVRHGVAPKGARGTVRIVVRREEGQLRIEVIDNGVGFQTSSPLRAGGVGIANVRARLRALHGDNQSVDILSEPGRGTTVTIVLPWREVSSRRLHALSLPGAAEPRRIRLHP